MVRSINLINLLSCAYFIKHSRCFSTTSHNTRFPWLADVILLFGSDWLWRSKCATFWALGGYAENRSTGNARAHSRARWAVRTLHARKRGTDTGPLRFRCVRSAAKRHRWFGGTSVPKVLAEGTCASRCRAGWKSMRWKSHRQSLEQLVATRSLTLAHGAVQTMASNEMSTAAQRTSFLKMVHRRIRYQPAAARYA